MEEENGIGADWIGRVLLSFSSLGLIRMLNEKGKFNKLENRRVTIFSKLKFNKVDSDPTCFTK